MKLKWKRLSIIVIVALGFFLSSTLDTEAAGKRVLFLSSYSLSWDSVPLQIKGIESVLGKDITLEYEFMDTKNLSDATSISQFYQYMKFKFTRQDPYDLVILGDDAALLFAMDYREELFSGIPLVFEGVNDLERAKSACEDPLVTGIVEQIPYEDNISIAKQLFPEANQIVALVDDTISGIGEQKQFEGMQDKYPDLNFSMINASKCSQEELGKEIAKVKENTLIFYLICSEDKFGNTYFPEEVTIMLDDNAKAPVFRMVMAGMDDGFVGGKIVSHEEMGSMSATMALSILNGTPPSEIEMVEDSPAYYYYNADVLEKFHVSTKKLPNKAILFNQAPTFWERYGRYMFSLALSLLALIVVAVIMVTYVYIRQRNKLIHRINSKNAELHKEIQRSEAAIEEAKRASHAKTDFLSRMSHDIRTPMNAIIGLSEIVSVNLDDKETVRDGIEKIHTSSKFLLSLINDILEMSRIESGKESLNLQKFDIYEMLNSIRVMIDNQAYEKMIQFHVKKARNVSQFYIGDYTKINQIIINLLSNALKFTRMGGTVQLSVREVDTTENWVKMEVVVKDTGIGISSNNVDKIFEPFEQLDSGTARDSLGSGLGLSIVKNFVELMNGSIKTESQVGEGSTFTVCVYLEKCQKTAEKKTTVKGTGRQKKEKIDILKDKSVLLVEDNKVNKEIAKNLLMSKGILVDTAKDGEEAVEMFMVSEAGHYMCILMDIRMPVMDGMEATRMIRNSEKEDARTISIVALTANAFEEDVKATREAGMNAHLGKPIEPAVLFQELYNIASVFERNKE